MADDLIQQIGEENSALRLQATESIMQGLADQGTYSTADLEEVEEYAIKYGAIITSLVVTIAEVAEKKGITAPLSLISNIYIGQKFTALNATIEILDDGSTWQESAVKAVGGYVAGVIAGKVAAGALGTLTIAGSGILSTGIGIAGTFAAAYFASSMVSDFIGDQWQYYVGPKVKGIWDQVYNSADFTVSGKFSDALRNKWDSMDAEADGEAINLDLNNLSEWTMQSTLAGEHMKLSYVRSTNTYTFVNASTSYIVDSFRDFESSGVDLGRAAMVEEILRHHQGNFNVAIEDTAPHLVHNYYGFSREQLQQLLNSGDKTATWAALNLTGYVEEVWDNYQSVETGHYSNHFLKDRATFLFHLLHSGEVSPTSEDIDFNDLQLQEKAYAGNGEIDLPGNAKYTFGTTLKDSISGSLIASRDDHLYGMGGNDTIKGHGGKDYIEGGEGQDTMYGGDDNDTFFVMGEDEAYDTFNGGDGTDTILGSDGNDTIRVHKFEGEDTVEIIDGGGGENIIAGTIFGDTIDLSSTELRYIKEIRGGYGNDTITGSAGNDRIYGEVGNDTLNGGAGENWLYGGADLDTYIVGEGMNHIIDEDNNGIIKDKQGNILNGTWKEQENGEFRHEISGIIATLNGTVFTIQLADGGVANINNFEDGYFGINLVEEISENPDPNTDGITVHGDLQAKKFYDDEGNLYYKYDEWGNIITTSVSEPGRRDDIRDTPGNDHLLGHGGIDYLHAYRGGDNIVEGGSGDDWIEDGDGDSLLIGGLDSDAIFAGAGQDTLYVDEIMDTDDVYTLGETNIGTGVRGDLLSGQDGEDQLYGWNGNDALAGGSGFDLIYGGAGDDTIEGDGNLHWWSNASIAWEVERTIEQQGNTTIYRRGYVSVMLDRSENLDDHGDDIIYAGSGNDWVFADGGNDFIDAGTGDDVVFGEAGSDTIIGQSGDDVLNGDSASEPVENHGEDYIEGGEGNDQIFGGKNDDILIGGIGDDLLKGDSGSIDSYDGNDYLDGGDGADDLVGGGGSDILYGGIGEDYLFGDEPGAISNGAFNGDDFLDGGGDNDYLIGGGGSDMLYGGTGDDALWGDESAATQEGSSHGKDILDGGIGDDQIIGGGDDDIAFGGDGADIIWGDDVESRLAADYHGNDILDGGTGDDQIIGVGGNDVISGGIGNDQLWGDDDVSRLAAENHGNDSIDGGDGEDSLFGGGGNDTLTGGAGNDWLAGEDELSSEDVSSLTGDDWLYGGTGDDTLVGGNGNDWLLGEEDNDRLYGGGGNDTLIGGAGNDFLMPGTGYDIMDGGEGDDTYYFSLGSGFKRIEDSDGNNRLILQGGINLNSIQLSLGSLMISSGTAGDELHLDGVDYDNLADTSPIDVIEFSDGQVMTTAEVIEAVGVDIAATENEDILTGTSGRDNINALAGDDDVDARGGNDVVTLGDGNDTAQGGAGDDNIAGDAGDDTVYGDDGNDSITGGTGADTLYGGNDDDVLHGDEDNDHLIGDSGNDQLHGGQGADLLYGGEGNDIIHGDTEDDQLYGDAGDDQLSGGQGVDLIHGGEGSDILNGDTENDQLYGDAGDDQLSGGQGTDLIHGGEGSDTLNGDSEDDQLFGNDGNDQLYGGEGSDSLEGGAGNDLLDGGVDADTMAGGLNDDNYLVDNIADVVIENVDEGLDTITTGLDYTLVDNVENLQLTEGSVATTGTGNELDNSITGNSQDNVLQGLDGADTLSGGIGNDTLDGGEGADNMIGGVGDDHYLVDNTGDNIIEQAGEGSDHVTATVSYTLAENVENLDLSGPAAENGVGNDGDNILTGNILNNNLEGRGGNDELQGDAGNDTLIGGTGADRMLGGVGDDIYSVDNTGDVVVELESEGIDRVESSIDHTLVDNVENLTLTGSLNISGTGNADDNILTGNIGNNSLNGLSGNDELYGGAGDDRLQGDAGTDLLYGGTGNDSYIIDSLEDTIVEQEGEGIDTVESSISYTLDNEVENLVLTGTENNTAVGNELDNLLTGNSGDNLLDGSTGADTMQGGEGNDTYLTDSIGDQIVEYSNEGSDIEIRSFDSTQELGDGVEQLTLSNGVIHGSGNSLDNTLTGNNENNILLGLAGDDRLIGGAGDDRMEGGEGNDTYIVDSLGDEVVEAADQGYDTVEINNNITLAANVEEAILTGSANINATGNELDNSLIGNSGDNQLDGGLGNDVMEGGAGDDTYYTDSLNDHIIEENGQGIDTEIRSHESLYLLSDNVENLTLVGEVYRGNGNELDNIITGNDAANNLWGCEGDDNLFGNGGDDQLIGDIGNDYLEGNEGNDLMSGGSGNDTLLGGAGNDQLDGGAGSNLLRGGIGDDTYVYRADGGVYEIDNSDGGEDWLLFTDDLTSDRLSFIKSGDDLIVRVDADENHQVTVKNWFLGTTYQLYAIQPSGMNGIMAETINQMFPPDNPEADGIEVPADLVFDMQLYGTAGGEEIRSATGNDILRGYQGNDYLYSFAGDDWLLGGSGNDQLDGGTGNDMLYGGSGDDVYVFRSGYGAETIDNSGGGIDWLFLADDLTLDQLSYIMDGDNLIIRIDDDANQQITVLNWFLGTEYQLYGISQDEMGVQITALQINDLFSGTGFDNIIEGTAANEIFEGSAGNDQISGMGGDDELRGNEGNDELIGGEGNDTLLGGAGDDTYIFNTGDGQDTIDTSGGGVDRLKFGAGIAVTSVLYSQSGNDLILSISGGSDTITVVNWFQDADYQLEYLEFDDGGQIVASQINDLFGGGGFDNVIEGTAANEIFEGSTGNDQISGMGGNDELRGNEGNDELIGGEGNDKLVGDSGDDTYVYSPGAGVDTIDNIGGGTDTLLFTDDITNDRLTYSQLEDNLIIQIDNDSASQITVKDWFIGTEYQLSYIQFADSTVITASQINDLFSSVSPGGDLEVPPENSFDTVVTGTSAAEQVVGTNGIDLLKGLEGNDQLFAFAGDDWLLGGDGDDYFDGGDGNDTMLGGAGSDQLGGDAGNDLMSGGLGDDTYVYRPGSGSDTIINSDGGTDWLIFTDDITEDRLSYFQSGDDLLVKIDGSTDTMVTVKDWFLGGENEVDYIQPAGGFGISAAQINTMVQQEPAAASMMAGGSDLVLAGSELGIAGMGNDIQYDSFNENYGLFSSDSYDLSVSNDLVSLDNTTDKINRELLAA